MWSKGLNNNKQFIEKLMSAATHANTGNWLRLLFSGESWRYQSIQQTLTTITNEHSLRELEHHAHNNMQRWQKNCSAPPGRVEVVTDDWGIACSDASQQYGGPYTVLNHASARFPGGGFLRLGTAQEENMWHRSTCALSLKSDHILFDSERYSFSYDEYMTNLVNGEIPMDPADIGLLDQKTRHPNHRAYQVYLDPTPQICFRGPECLINHAGEMDAASGKNTIFAEPEFSFQFLPHDSIFPFYELRSAAPNLTSDHQNWDDPKFARIYHEAIQRCIAAQLDTLIAQGKKQIILGAWGCGEFHNDPNIIASTYKEEIYKRSKHFQHIVFAILRNTSHHHINHTAFQNHLADLKLGSKAKTIILPPESVKNSPGMR